MTLDVQIASFMGKNTYDSILMYYYYKSKSINICIDLIIFRTIHVDFSLYLFKYATNRLSAEQLK